MANIQIKELNSELMTEAIANAQARRNNFISELSEEQTAEVLGGKFPPIFHFLGYFPMGEDVYFDLCFPNKY
ncbi:MAG: hypothetical protein F6K23_33400 [Okeania sp. SIO2C9]|uniref:hypothetical protein n=1 Tax=Okeania sp. SIO2C9 TaxID=2607791 RepID=UPI0013C0ECC7|nr:hypothetical protein [Okeania sp. SIO2C9]NEQ77477.1 hypothetical protein [Okeania sp. SIO2C9]